MRVEGREVGGNKATVAARESESGLTGQQRVKHRQAYPMQLHLLLLLRLLLLFLHLPLPTLSLSGNHLALLLKR